MTAPSAEQAGSSSLPDPASLAGRRVAVTGARGFLGSHVVAELERAGAQALPVASDRYDLVDREAVRRMYADLRPSVVVHAAAAVGGIGANVANPGHFLHANAVMGLHLLDEARLAGLERFVLVSTTCTYPEDAPNPLREDTIWDGAPTGATGPYGMAKRLLHEACATFERQYGLSSAVVVLANLYGPGDHYAPETSHVAPMMARRYLEAARDGVDEVVNWGSGTPTREFLHVTDAARALVLAAASGCGSAPINVGTGRETSIRELAEVLAAAAGYEGTTRWDTTRPDGTPRRVLDVSRAETVLGFRARVGLEGGMAETVAWLREELAGVHA